MDVAVSGVRLRVAAGFGLVAGEQFWSGPSVQPRHARTASSEITAARSGSRSNAKAAASSFITGTFAPSLSATGHRRWTASRRPSGQAAPQRISTTAGRRARRWQPTCAPASPKLQSEAGRLPDQASRPTLQQPAIAGVTLQPLTGQDRCPVQVKVARSRLRLRVILRGPDIGCERRSMGAAWR